MYRFMLSFSLASIVLLTNAIASPATTDENPAAPQVTIAAEAPAETVDTAPASAVAEPETAIMPADSPAASTETK